MTKLQSAALGRIPLPLEEVERMYAQSALHPLAQRSRDLTRLCESHERLRAELAGLTVLLEESERQRQYAVEQCRRQPLPTPSDN